MVHIYTCTADRADRGPPDIVIHAHLVYIRKLHPNTAHYSNMINSNTGSDSGKSTNATNGTTTPATFTSSSTSLSRSTTHEEVNDGSHGTSTVLGFLHPSIAAGLTAQGGTDQSCISCSEPSGHGQLTQVEVIATWYKGAAKTEDGTIVLVRTRGQTESRTISIALIPHADT